MFYGHRDHLEHNEQVLVDVTLDPVEVRVLGALVEKDLSTPDYYPMTLNALTAACNQKSNRDPVVAFSEDDVRDALERLQRRRLAGTVSGAASRAVKYRHALAEAYGLDRPAQAVLASLMLRGPQTVGEIRGRTGRMYAFETLEAVEDVLGRLQAHEPPLATLLPRRSGQKEARYAHLLAGVPDVGEEAEPEDVPVGGSRITQLEEEVADLRTRLEQLEAAFFAFRKQFE